MSDGRDISQSQRLIVLDTPLGRDVLIGRNVTVREAISRPFLIEVEAFSKDQTITADQMIGKMIKVTIQPHSQLPSRDFHGVVRSFTRGGVFERGFTAYRIEAVPRAWMFSRTADCRIYQNKTVQQIIEDLFNENNGCGTPICQGLPSQPRVYCTQYMETDLDFMQRILDECGGAYYFDHSGGQDQIKCIGGQGPWPSFGAALTASGVAGGMSYDRLTNWSPVGGMIPSKVEAFDFDQKHPRKDMKQVATTVLPAAKADHWEMFIWSGGQDVVPGIDVARIAMETAEAMAETFTATARDPRVSPGSKLTVKEDESGGESKPCLILSVTHTAFDDTHLSGGGDSGYQADMRMMRSDRPFRNPTPRSRPVMPGLMSALVTGEPGSEIHTDDLGRIKVSMLWDRKGPKDHLSSCWVRVLQPFAGAWGGTWFLPRVGDEVVVGFMNGNPDYPVVVGSVYNMDGKPPFSLPGNKTQSGFKSRSSLKGGSDNANILRIDDNKGNEEFFFQAEKDMNVLVKNNRTVTVKADHTETIYNNRSSTIKTGNETLTVSKGNMDTKVSMGNVSNVISMGNLDTKLDMGNMSLKTSLGSQSQEAMQSISLKVGQSEITIDQMGITIKGMSIKIDGVLSTKVSGLMTDVTGTAMLKLGGGITMIG